MLMLVSTNLVKFEIDELEFALDDLLTLLEALYPPIPSSISTKLLKLSNSLSISFVSGFPKGPLLPENDPGPEDVWKQFLWLCRRMAGTLRWAFRNVGRRDLLPSLPSHRCNLQGKGDVP